MAIREYHAPWFLAAFLLLLVLVGGYFFYDMKHQEKATRAQEIQALRDCEERYKVDAGDLQVSFEGISVERFGATRIIISGAAVYTSPSGQARTEKMNCSIDVPAIGN